MMASKKPNANTLAIITAIENSNKSTRVIVDSVASELAAHTRLDDSRHEENKQTLAIIAADVKSLLESRSYSRGIWKTVTVIATVVSGSISIVIAIMRGH